VLGAALLAALPASAYERPPLLERVASYFAMRPAEVRCPSFEKWLRDPIWGLAAVSRGWGYTDMIGDYVVQHPAGEWGCACSVRVAGVDQSVWHEVAGVPYLVRIADIGVRAPKSPIPGHDVAELTGAIPRRRGG
jgi:hypothetical protein